MRSGVRGMKIFLAGFATSLSLLKRGYAFKTMVESNGVNLLDSYYYLRGHQNETKKWFSEFRKSDKCRAFLLDSGAFTFMSGTNGDIDINDYVDGYCDFINKEKIDHFFEMDIDVVTGYETVLDMRERIERKTSKKCIPVWHESRGSEEFKQMCHDYDFVSIGGIASKEMTREKVRKIIPPLIRYAHREGCRIHGLGIAKPLGGMIDFDSIDSTSWSTGVRYGTSIMHFNGHDLIVKKIESTKKGHWDNQVDQAIKEWIKYADYMEFDYKAGI